MGWHDLARVVSTMGPLGHIPTAPGTAAALATTAVGFVVLRAAGHPALAALALMTIVIGQWACVARADAHDDPREVVIDEAAGQLLALVALRPTVVLYAAAFAAFRVFDVWKPWPIRRIDAHGGSWSVMGDDLVAGCMARCVVLPLELLL